MLYCHLIPRRDFYPRSPCGERQRAENHASSQQEFLSTLSLRRATSEIPLHCFAIHNFYPRSPCGERLMHALKLADTMLFLSTLSLRRATTMPGIGHINKTNFYPRSPCGERPAFDVLAVSALLISIHALLAESDGIGLVFLWWGVRFLSTLSLRRATAVTTVVVGPSRDFYPRSPCGERLLRHSANCSCHNISIHALLAESDSTFINCNSNFTQFLSTLSLRRATWGLMGGLNCDAYFYPRSPCGERQLC